MTPYETAPDEYAQARYISIIPRWSVVPVNRRQTNGEHIFLVTRYVEIIYNYLSLHEFGPIGDFLLHALHHDDDEARDGDLPSGSMLATNKIKSEDAPKLVRLVTKLADRMEAYHYTIEEERLGNAFMKGEWNKTEEKYREAYNMLIDHINKLRKGRKDSSE